MKNRLTCAVVNDLLPLYIDKLTCLETNQLVEEHLENCKECKEKFNRMNNSEICNFEGEEQAEIDFLKRTKKGYMRKILLSIVIVISVIACLAIGKIYIIGSKIPPENVNTIVEVNKNQIEIEATSTSDMIRINDMKFVEKEGVICVTFKGVKGKNGNEIYKDSYLGKDNIKKVMIGNRVVWCNGVNVDLRTSKAFATAHSYVGDAVENANTIEALGVTDYLGNYTLELQTTKEPYECKIVLKDVVSNSAMDGKIKHMKTFSYALLGLIDNLDVVTFEFDSEKERVKVETSTKEASVYLGENVKVLSKDVVKLENVLANLYE